MHVLAKIIAAACVVTSSVAAFAQDYPTRTIRVIVPLTPASGADIAGRIVARYMSEKWHQSIVVENRPGAGGQIGTTAVVSAPPDGYTLMIQSASHAANSAIYKNLPYDPLKQLVDVALLGVTPYILVTSPKGPYKTLKALIDAAKAKPGDIPFASAGVGSSTHLAAEYFVDSAGVKMLHIPYKGSPEAIQDTIAGRTAFYMAPINTAAQLVQEGQLLALGVSTRQRADVLPNVVPLAEQGIANYDVALWFGMWAPAGTPPAVVKKLNDEVAAVLKMPVVKDQFQKLGIDPKSMTPDEFAKFVRSEMSIYQRIVTSAGIQQR